MATMATGDGTSDGLGREEHTRTKSLGNATQENKMSTALALESQSSPEKIHNPEIPSTLNIAQNLTFSKGKQASQDSKYGHDSMDQSKQSSTSCPIGSFRDGPVIIPSSNQERIIASGPSSSSKKRLIQALHETDSQTHGPHPAQSNLEGVAASVAPGGATAVELNIGSVVALLGEASLEANGAPLVVLNDVGRAEPNIGPIVILRGVALSQSNAALIVALPGEVLAEANIAPNVAPRAPAVVAPRGLAPVAPDVAPHAQRNGALLAPAQPNAALIVAPRGLALAQPNAAAIVAPPAVAVLNVNRGLKRSRLKPLRICEIGSEGHFWPKLPRS